MNLNQGYEIPFFDFSDEQFHPVPDDESPSTAIKRERETSRESNRINMGEQLKKRGRPRGSSSKRRPSARLYFGSGMDNKMRERANKLLRERGFQFFNRRIVPPINYRLTDIDLLGRDLYITNDGVDLHVDTLSSLHPRRQINNVEHLRAAVEFRLFMTTIVESGQLFLWREFCCSTFVPLTGLFCNIIEHKIKQNHDRFLVETQTFKDFMECTLHIMYNGECLEKCDDEIIIACVTRRETHIMVENVTINNGLLVLIIDGKCLNSTITLDDNVRCYFPSVEVWHTGNDIPFWYINNRMICNAWLPEINSNIVVWISIRNCEYTIVKGLGYT